MNFTLVPSGPAATSTTLTRTIGTTPTVYGSTLTYTATVSGSPGPGNVGTVTFTDGATTICSAVPLAAGTATCSPAKLPVGSYSLTAQYSGGAGFAASTSSPAVAQVVTAKPLTGLFAAPNKVYDRTDAATANSRTLTGVVSGDAVSLTGGTATFGSRTVGTGKTVTLAGATLSGADAGNYSLASVSTTTADITAKSLTGSFTAPNKVYDGTTAATVNTPSLTGVISGDTVTLGGTATFDNKNVGTGRTVTLNSPTLGGADAGNYSLTSVSTVTANITAKALTITASNQSKTYGDTFSFTGSEFTTGSGQLVAGDAVASVTLTSAGAVASAPVQAGGYPIIPSAATGSGLGNYTISYVNGTLTLGKKAQTITFASPGPKAFGDSFIASPTADSGLSVALVATGGCASQANPDSVPVSYTVTITSGTTNCVLTASQPGSGNYLGAADVVRTVNVSKKQLTVTADDDSKEYGSANPSPLGFGYSDDFVGTDGPGDVDTAPTCSTSAVLLSPVDGYPITCSGAADENYSFAYVGGTLSVTKKAITVTADAKSKTYGQDDPPLTYQVTAGALESGDAFTGALDREAGQNVGSYAIRKNTLSAGANYDLSYVGANLVIGQKVLTVTADDQSKTYGDVFTFDGTEFSTGAGDLESGDSVDSVTLTSDGAGEGASVAGSKYDIVASDAAGSGLGNYAISYVDGKFEVTKKVLTVTADDQSKTYGDVFTFDGTEFSTGAGDLESGDSVDSVTLTSDGAGEGASVAGSKYDIVASDAAGSGLGNYAISYVDGKFEVTKKVLTVTADDQSKTYGDVFTFDGTEFSTGAGDLESGDSVDSVTLISDGAGEGASVAGSKYDIVASSCGSGLGNYAISYVDGKFEVTKKVLTVTADDQSKTYGDVFTFDGTEFSTGAGDLESGDSVDSVTLISDGAGEAASVAGSKYDIVASELRVRGWVTTRSATSTASSR